MSELEVGQVWESNVSSCKILDLFTLNGCACVAFSLWVAGRFNDVGHAKVDELFATKLTLIRRADGTPVEKPKKYKELTPVEAMRLLADAGQPIECQASDFDERWSDIILTGSDLDDDASWPFTSVCGSFKQCRIEVTND